MERRAVLLSAPATGKPEKQKGAARRWRPLLRALHRDTGYLAVGLTLIYATSGLAVNHIGDWDPNFHDQATTHDLGPLPPLADEPLATLVRTKLAIPEVPREVYRASPTELDITFDKRSLYVNPVTGHVADEGQKPRFFLRLANWLHLNRGKKQWRYVADGYAVGLLFLSLSGLFMVPGRRGLLGRGAFFVLLGALIPAAYVVLSGGP